MKKWLDAFWVLSKKEKVSGLVLFVLLFGAIIINLSVKHFVNQRNDDISITLSTYGIPQDDTPNENLSENLSLNHKQQDSPPKYDYFNPNEVSQDQLVRMGVSEKTAKAWINYRANGGKFYTPNDIKKIYGLNESTAEKLIPYCVIPQTEKTSKPESKYQIVELNTADSASLEALPGLGAKLSKRVITYRSILGGYYRVEQLLEVYGMPYEQYDKCKNYLNVNPALVQRLNINKLNAYALKKHPYFRNGIAEELIKQRNVKKQFSTKADIDTNEILTDSVLIKISPYLNFENE